MAKLWLLCPSLALCTGALPATAAPPIALSIPVECEIGGRCLIQKLFDHDPTPARLDYSCGVLTTDGHDGVDFRLRTMADMRAGVAVLAAAGGTVLRVRDSEPDISVKIRKDLNGRDAGNGVVIDHGNGWVTQYSHLRFGSVGVKPGQQVRAGERLGLIGMSGNAEFPHLHFSLRFHDKSIDPFTGPTGAGDCAVKQANTGSLWNSGAARMLRYQPTAVIAIGMASEVPAQWVADRGGPDRPPGRTNPIIAWADLFGSMKGDVERFRITGPDKDAILDQSRTLDQGHLSRFAYAGRRAPAGGWKQGRYITSYELTRGTAIIAQSHAETIIR